MRYGLGVCSAIRLDPVKFRVALPAADPPDNANDHTDCPPTGWTVLHVYCGYTPPP